MCARYSIQITIMAEIVALVAVAVDVAVVGGVVVTIITEMIEPKVGDLTRSGLRPGEYIYIYIYIGGCQCIRPFSC